MNDDDQVFQTGEEPPIDTASPLTEDAAVFVDAVTPVMVESSVEQSEQQDDSLRIIDPFEDAAAQYAAQYEDSEPSAADQDEIVETVPFASTAVLETSAFGDEPGEVIASADPAQEVVVPVNSAEIVQAEVDEPPQTFFGWAWASLMGRGYSQAMLQDLNAALADQPDVLTNLVLRGEIHLKRRDYAAAQADFERALTLGENQVRQARWGVVPQVMVDRAVAGLHEAQRA